MLHRRSATKKVEFERTTKERAPLPGDAHSEAGMTAKEFLRGIRRLDAIIDCKQARIDLWTEEEENLLREHLRNGGGFSWESMRKLAKKLGRTVVAVRARLTKIRKEEKEKR